MNRFKIKYNTIKYVEDIKYGRYSIEGPEIRNYINDYWLYHIIKDVEPNITVEPKPENTAIRTTHRGFIPKIVSYALVDTLQHRYIDFEGFQDTKNNNRKIVIYNFGYDNRYSVPKNYDNYKDLFNEIIRIVSLINEKNENNKIKLFIDRSSIENYTDDKQKWKTSSNLGQFDPTFFSKIGFNNKLEWIPNKDTNISDYNSKNIGNAIAQKRVDDGTATGTKKYIDPAAVNQIMGFLGDTNIKHFTKGGKRKTKNQKKSRKSRKSKKRNQTNKNH